MAFDEVKPNGFAPASNTAAWRGKKHKLHFPHRPPQRKPPLNPFSTPLPSRNRDLLKCGHCGGRREVLKCITDPKVIDRILTHLGLKSELPEVAPARAPPGSEQLFEY